MGASAVDFWSTFWPGFCGNLAADVVVSVGLLLLLPRALAQIRGEKLRVVVSVSDLTDSSLAVFYVQNVGRQAFHADDIYWHVYLEQDGLEFERIRDNDRNPMRHYSHHMIGGKPYEAFDGQLKAPIFPDRSMELFNMVLRDEPTSSVETAIGSGVFLYSLSTARGVFPRQVNPLRLLFSRLFKRRLLEKGYGVIVAVPGGSWNIKPM